MQHDRAFWPLSEPTYRSGSGWDVFHPFRPRSQPSSYTPTNAPLSELRNALLQDLDEAVPLVSVEFFQDSLLPDLPLNVDVDAVINRLARRETYSKGRWKYWPQDPAVSDKTPEGVVTNEDVVFAHIATLSNDVKEACVITTHGLTDRDVKSVLKCNPSCIPHASSRQHRKNTRPDAYALLKSYDSDIHWCDVAIPGEFKKKSGQPQKQDNYEKVLWSMHWIMQEDARRRFVFGFTIANTSMRMWFCSRSEVLVSEEFDIMANRRALVDFLIRITFATRLQLGYDETIVRCPGLTGMDVSVVYEIAVRSDNKQKPPIKWYRTVRLISELGASTIRGRGTRVWEVVELDKPSGQAVGLRTYVVKDIWLDKGRRSEGIALEELYKKVSGTDAEDIFKKSFMTTRRYGDVYVHGRRPDITDCFKLSRLQSAPLPSCPEFLRIPIGPEPLKVVTTRQGTVTVANQAGNFPRQYTRYSDKVHHRVVFNEVGKPIFQVKSLHKAFSHIGQVFLGAWFAPFAAPVLTYGNVLIVGDQAKITDLEYAKEENDNSEPHDIRTGTLYFMSTEVYRHRYQHRSFVAGPGPGPAPPAPIDLNTDFTALSDAEEDIEAPIQASDAVDSLSTVAFRYNPLHDLESLFWLCLFLLLGATFKNDKHHSPSQIAGFGAKQEALYHRVFNDFSERIEIMVEGTAFSGLYSDLHPTVSAIMTHLESMRIVLVDAFVTMNADRPVPFSVGPETAGKMGAYVKPIIKRLREHDLEILVEEDFRPRGTGEVENGGDTGVDSQALQGSVEVDPCSNVVQSSERVTRSGTKKQFRSQANTATSSQETSADGVAPSRTREVDGCCYQEDDYSWRKIIHWEDHSTFASR
ncbi:uncharacterized protein PHACADRAFT_209774, partial [Phanerochaete carnosa HHB-10118-sp]